MLSQKLILLIFQQQQLNYFGFQKLKTSKQLLSMKTGHDEVCGMLRKSLLRYETCQDLELACQNVLRTGLLKNGRL
jgi:hypothetical protein